MTDEKQKDKNRDEVRIPEKDQGKAKTMAAGATFGNSDREHQELKQKPAEAAGQGGGIQGTGQRNPTPNKGKTGQEVKARPGDEQRSKRVRDQDEY